MAMTVDELYNSNVNPKINSVTLDILRQYYQKYLEPNRYKYSLNTGDKVEDLELRFDKENFCHLLGIESIVKRNVRYKERFNYKGNKGWENIEEQIVTFKTLKDINKRGFNNNKARFVFMYLLPRLLENPSAVKFEKERVAKKTNVECEIMFYDSIHNAYIHIGIENDEELGYYIPRTFLIEKISETNDGTIFIDNQTEIIVESLKKETS